MGTKGTNYPAKPSRKPDPRPSPPQTRGHKTALFSRLRVPTRFKQTITIPDRSSPTTFPIKPPTSHSPPIYTLPTNPVAPHHLPTSPPHTPSTPPPSPPSALLLLNPPHVRTSRSPVVASPTLPRLFAPTFRTSCRNHYTPTTPLSRPVACFPASHVI